MAEKKTTTKKVATKKTTTKKTKQKQTLVIVESPAKAKTIENISTWFKVEASMGHLIDLPKSRLAINVEDRFQPEYITVRGRAKF